MTRPLVSRNPYREFRWKQNTTASAIIVNSTTRRGTRWPADDLCMPIRRAICRRFTRFAAQTLKVKGDFLGVLPLKCWPSWLLSPPLSASPPPYHHPLPLPLPLPQMLLIFSFPVFEGNLWAQVSKTAPNGAAKCFFFMFWHRAPGEDRPPAHSPIHPTIHPPPGTAVWTDTYNFSLSLVTFLYIICFCTCFCHFAVL